MTMPTTAGGLVAWVADALDESGTMLGIEPEDIAMIAREAVVAVRDWFASEGPVVHVVLPPLHTDS